MGDAPFITALSAIPLLTIVFSIAVVIFLWRTKRRTVGKVIGILMIVAGVFLTFSPYGMLFSIEGGVLIAVLGVVLFLVSRFNGGKGDV
jgi:drug/metabolite transporter (DMT)-like permease